MTGPKSGFAEWTTITPIFSYVTTMVPPAALIAFLTELIVRWSSRVLTTYARFGASAAWAAVPVSTAGTAEAADGRKPSEAVSDSTTGTARASRRLGRR